MLILERTSWTSYPAPGKRRPDQQLKRMHMYTRLEFYFETFPLKRRLYFSVWCTNLSRVRQEMSISATCKISRTLDFEHTSIEKIYHDLVVCS